MSARSRPIYATTAHGETFAAAPGSIPQPHPRRTKHQRAVIQRAFDECESGGRRNRRETTMKRARVYIRDRYRCQYCGDHRHAKDLTLDHILPRAQGGESTPANLVTACVKCNQRKGNRTPEQARMPLLTSQKLLRLGLDHVLLCHYAESRPEWKKYLFMDDHTEVEQVKVAA